jgi:D-alanyl-D-alanine carboxypeptidase
MEDPPKGMVAIKGQKTKSRKTGKEATLITQYLPRPVHQAYIRLNGAMRRDIGSGVLMFAAYRSPAYQLALVMRYYSLYGHSMAKVLQWSALPGYTEHGDPLRPAVDFTAEGGFFDEPFVKTSAYAWLTQHAKHYAFAESYPQGNGFGIGHEPWHFRYIGK